MAVVPKKTTQLTTATVLGANDYFIGIQDPLGNPATIKIQPSYVFANIAYSATFKANVTFTANNQANIAHAKIANLTIGDSFTPSTSGDTAQAGKIWYDNNYLYIAVAGNVIKRVALTSF